MAGVIVAAMLTAAPVDAKKPSPSQKIEGQILVGTPNCVTKLHEVLIQAGMGQETAYYTFDVDKRTWQRPFVLEVTGGTDITGFDLILIYYNDYPSVGDLTYAGFVQFDGTGPDGGEKGIVPATMNKGMIILCQAGFINPGETPQVGLEASFSYIAKGKKEKFTGN
ncbi:MAG TPA: hypothetical protein VNC78_09080 [Actinomycetota bacterium]|nr:hypothetical protein [Actinomycetota bacterium]